MTLHRRPAAWLIFALTSLTLSSSCLATQETADSNSGSDAVGQCVDSTGENCEWSMERYLEMNNATDKEEEDPNLQLMPDYNFKAYVRPDISTYYQEKPGSRKEVRPKFRGQAGKFLNMSPEPMALYWESKPDDLILNSPKVDAWANGGTACFAGHSFVFTKLNSKEVVCRIKVVPSVSSYYCDPFRPNDKSNRALGTQISNETRSLDTLSPEDRARYDAHIYNQEFAPEYKKFTGGSEWLSMLPRNPPLHPMWRADYFGQEHLVLTSETHFHTIPESTQLRKLSRVDLRRTDKENALLFPEHRDPEPLNLTLTALSCMPRVFEIKGFLSETEADHIVQLAEEQTLERSTTNGQVSSTRTSRTAWLSRGTDAIVDTIYRRVAAVLKLDEGLLRERFPGEEIPGRNSTRRINEDLQIVHYSVGQEYTPHHDFGYPTGKPDSPSRSINLCMYLNNVEEGGETSFPRWRNGHTSEGLKVKPEKGKAVIFYMVDPDGNLQDLAQHAGMPVLKGEKYFTNLWIHDPIRI